VGRRYNTQVKSVLRATQISAAIPAGVRLTRTDLAPFLSVRSGRLHVEDCDAADLAREFGTPLFVISETHLRRGLQRYQRAFEECWGEGSVRIMPSFKACPIVAVRKALTQEGAGCDCFGPGEIEGALRGGVRPRDISVNGSIKDEALIERAVDIGARIVLDSRRELDLCEQVATRLGKQAFVMFRMKPYMANVHEPSDFYPVREIREMTQTIKYGIPNSALLPMGRRSLELAHVLPVGVHMHMGRHSKKLSIWQAMIREYVALLARLRDAMDGWTPNEVDFGGGFAAAADRETRVAVTDYPTPPIEMYAKAMTSEFREAMAGHGIPTEGIQIEVEPGRGLHNEAGIHLTTVRNIKRELEHIEWAWAEVDTSEVFLSIGSLNEEPPFDWLVANKADSEPVGRWDVVGLTCNYDCLYEQVEAPQLEAGDVLALLNTGSYIEPMAANFNALPRPGTVLVNGAEADLVKRHETVDEVFQRDEVPPRLRS